MVDITKSEFSTALRKYFKADTGAYSVVTDREFFDSQVTLSGAESELVASFAEKWLSTRRGSVSALEEKGIDAGYNFRIHPTGEVATLNLIYPKPKKNELRLYLRAGYFKPQANTYWCVFLREGELWLGSFDFLLLSTIESLPFALPADTIRDEFLEPEVDTFQLELNKPPEQILQNEKMLWGRNPSVARNAIIQAGYKCELFPTYPEFISRVSGNPFVEAHHLIPMKMQHKFEYSLDIEENICVLSPYGHRLLHHGRSEDISFHIEALAKKRSELLNALEIHRDDVLSLYS